MRAPFTTSLVFALCLAWDVEVHAGSMDPAVERLIESSSESCRTDGGAIRLPQDGSAYLSCQPDNAAFRRLTAQYAFAFAPTAMHSAASTGLAGFQLSLQAAYTDIDEGADYWKRGTRGATDSSSGRASTLNSTPQPMLQLYSLKLTKSVGWGLELAGETGFMPQTSLWSMGADVRVSLLEGFRKGVLGAVPDVAVGGGVRTVTGVSAFHLTIASLDTQISKRFVLADKIVLSPWIGYQYLWTFVDSNVVDFTPATDEAELCNYVGVDAPSTPPPAGSTEEYTGQSICGPGGSSIDFENNRIFDRARLERQRLIVGARLRHESVLFGLAALVDLVDPADAQNDDADQRALEGMPSQWTGVIELGAVF